MNRPYPIYIGALPLLAADAPCPNPDQECVQWVDPAMFPPDDPKLEIGICRIPP